MSNITTIISIGELLVEFVSHRTDCGLRQVGDYSGPYPSGAPAIFLDQAARMGAPTKMIGGVGDDGFGQILLERLKQDGVGTDGIAILPDLSTGVAFVSYYSDGNRDFIFHLTNTAADNFKSPSKLPDLLNAILHISAASLGNAAMREQIMLVASKVVLAGGRISCDPNARPELMRDDAVLIALNEIMNLATWLMPSTSDLGFLFPNLSESEAIDRLIEMKTEEIIVKRGAEGATVLKGEERYDFPAHKVDEIDPTGAGDCFCGTYLALRAQGVSLFEAGKQANAAGAIAVTRRGPMEGNSGPEEITSFLNK